MCFTGDTRVKLLNGTTPTFEELVEMEKENPGQEYWVYSRDENGNIVPGKATNPRITGYKTEIMQLEFDDDSIIKCTPDHLIMLKDGSYKEAQDLTEEDSIMPLYYKQNTNECYINKDREMVFDVDNKWKFTHRIVMENLEPEKNVPGQAVHHKDSNYLNNDPKNLCWMATLDHNKYHLIKYNTSPEKSERNKVLHQQGVYTHTYFGNNGYNGSQLQKEHIRKSYENNEQRRELNRQIMINYNHTQKNKDSTIALNKREDIKILQTRSKLINSGRALIALGYVLSENLLKNNEELKDKITRVPTLKSINKYFSNIEEYIMICNKEKIDDITLSKLLINENIINNRKQSNIKTKSNQILKVLKYLLENNIEITENNYMNCRKNIDSKSPRYENIGLYFSSINEAVEKAKYYNHKIISKKIIKLDNPIPVYDLTVEEYHNFAICCNDNSGIFVHNCEYETLI